jgi:hypothetical protein
VDACNPLLQAHPTWARDKNTKAAGFPPPSFAPAALSSPLRAPSRADPSGLGHAATFHSSAQGPPPVSKRRQFYFVAFMLFHYVSLWKTLSHVLTLWRSVKSRGQRSLHLTCVALVFNTISGIEIKYQHHRTTYIYIKLQSNIIEFNRITCNYHW